MSSPGYPDRRYPDARYHGERGETSAWFRPASAAPELPRPGGSASYLATGGSTDGGYGLYRWDMGPEPAGPGPHFHRTMSEAFFVLSGQVRLHTGEQWVEAGPGDFAHVPPGGVHGFRNDSGEPASMLILFVPGAPREAYFEGLVDLAEGRWTPDDAELRAFFVEHDNHYL